MSMAHATCLAIAIFVAGLKTGRQIPIAAAAGGVTTMVTRPDTDPVIDNPETLEFVIRRAREAAPVNVLPMAALTKGRQGREMTEIGFLLDAGAVAFTDCDHVVSDTKVFGRALSYARSLGALVLGHPQEPTLSAGRSEERRVGKECRSRWSPYP